MGEYWKPINVTRKEYIYPHSHNAGLNLGEWLYGPKCRILALASRWSPTDDVRIVSDYDGDIRVTESAKTSDEVVTYFDADEKFSETQCPDGDPGSIPPRAFYEAAKSNIRYEDVHENWSEK